MRRLLAAVLLAAFCAADVHAAAAEMKILSGSAKVTKADGTVVTLNAGDTIPSGSKVEVVAGEATFQSGSAVVKAEAGESFSYAATGGNPQITSNTGTITVTVGNTTATLEKGDGISVQGKGGQAAEIKVTSGEVTVATNGKTETLATGGTSTAQTPPESVPVTQTSESTQEQTTTTSQTQTTTNPTQETTTTPVSPSSP